MGSISHGASVPEPDRRISFCALRSDEGPMTRARRRRLAESFERLGPNRRALVQDLAAGTQGWRDWANLTSGLVEHIAGRPLSHDVAEYLRFRAVCRPWRGFTADPRDFTALDNRFRPRNWMVVTISPIAGPRRCLLNVATGASLKVDLPALNSHCHLCAVDGLLVLFNRITKAICLLDPLSKAVTEFPVLSSIVAAEPTSHISAVFRSRCGVDSNKVNGAGFDDSTYPPTLVLCLRDNVSNIIFAKPGDAHWTLVNQGQAYHQEYRLMGRVLYHTLLSRGGRCYVSSPEGSIYLLELQPLPQLVVIIDQREAATRDAIVYTRILSYLIGAQDGRMLMVQYWRNVEHFVGRLSHNSMENFTVGGITSRIEVYQVDISGRRLVAMRTLGHYAAFIGMTHCLLISTKTFPSIAADAIYMGYYYQPSRKFSIYHLNSRRTEPPHEFDLDEKHMVVPRARPCNLDQYLVCYVDRKHSLSGQCINHVDHYLWAFF